MKVEDLAKELIFTYFNNVSGILIYGSQSHNKEIDPERDLDLLVLCDSAYTRGVQGFKYKEITFDITFISTVNFEQIFLQELRFPRLSAMLHAFATGRIILDLNNKLGSYKELAFTIFNDSKNFSKFTTLYFANLIKVAYKLLSDLKIRKNSLEYFVLVGHLVETYLDIELIHNIGYTQFGKIKIRLLKEIDPTITSQIEFLLMQQHGLQKNPLLEKFIKKRIDFYSKTIINKRNNLLPNFFVGQHLIFEITESDVFNFLLNNFILADKNISYYYFQPYTLLDISTYRIIIKGDKNYLKKYILPRFEKIRIETIHSISPAFNDLDELLQGGTNLFRKSEFFYFYLGSYTINKREQGDTTIAIKTFMVILKFLKTKGVNIKDFLNYLYELWIAYSYDHPSITYSELKKRRKIIESIFYSNFKSQLIELNDIAKSVSLKRANTHSGDDWDFIKNIKKLISAVFETDIYIPIYEEKLLEQYSIDKIAFGIRKQLEIAFKIMGISERHWSYFVFTCNQLIR